MSPLHFPFKSLATGSHRSTVRPVLGSKTGNRTLAGSAALAYILTR